MITNISFKYETFHKQKKMGLSAPSIEYNNPSFFIRKMIDKTTFPPHFANIPNQVFKYVANDKPFNSNIGLCKQDNKQKNKLVNKTPIWVEIAKSQLGVKEIEGKMHNMKIVEYHSATTGKFKDDETPWCSSFVNWVMLKSGLSGTKSASALSWKKWGQDLGKKPAYGSLAVISYGDGKGHVGFVMGKNTLDQIILLGGNQSNSVKYSAFSSKKIVAFVYPMGYIPNYELPLIDIKGNNSFKSTR